MSADKTTPEYTPEQLRAMAELMESDSGPRPDISRVAELYRAHASALEELARLKAENERLREENESVFDIKAWQKEMDDMRVMVASAHIERDTHAAVIARAERAEAELAESRQLHAAMCREADSLSALVFKQGEQLASMEARPEWIKAGDGTLHGAIDHWQERATKAEAQLAERDAELAKHRIDVRVVDTEEQAAMKAELAALKGHAEAMHEHGRAALYKAGTTENGPLEVALDRYRAAYPKEADK